MKNLVVSFVLFFISFAGYAQVDTNEVSFKNLSPLFDQYCENDYDLKSKFFIPLSVDSFGIQIFKQTIEQTFSNLNYIANVLDYKTDKTYISDIWIEINDNNNESIVVQFCILNNVFKTGRLFDEYKIVFDFIQKNTI